MTLVVQPCHSDWCRSQRQKELLSTMALVQLPEFAALKGESLGQKLTGSCHVGQLGMSQNLKKKHFVSKLWMKIHWSAILMFAMGQGELTHGQLIHLSDSWDFSLSLSNMDRHKHGAMRLNYEAAEMVQNALYAEKIEVPVKALSGKLYVRSLDLDWTGADLGKQMWYGCRKFGAQRVQFQLIFYFGNSTFGQITIRRISLGRWGETKNNCHQRRCQGISAHIYNHIEVGPSARGS